MESKKIDDLLHSDAIGSLIQGQGNIYKFPAPSEIIRNAPQSRNLNSIQTNNRNASQSSNQTQFISVEPRNQTFNKEMQNATENLKNMQKVLEEIKAEMSYSSLKSLSESVDAEKFARKELKQFATIINRFSGILCIIINIFLFVRTWINIFEPDED